MSAVDSILAAVYTRLATDATLQALATGGIYAQAQKPPGVSNPVLLVFLRSAVESGKVGVLSDTYLDLVARDGVSEGEGTTLTAIFDRVDELLNGYYVATLSALGTLGRAGLTVNPALYDEVQNDWFKRWTYRVIVKRQQ